MKNREHILKSTNRPEDRLVIARLLDKAEIAAKTHKFVHSEFLDPHQVILAENVLTYSDICEVTFYGGFPGAERSVAVFTPEYADEDEKEKYINEILRALKITPNARENLTHRDYLGALMGLGIRREVTGDILVNDNDCNVIVLKEIAGYITDNLFKVGNTGVSVTVSDCLELTLPEPKVIDRKTTVSTLRLDSCCAQAFGISRSKAAEFIKSGRVKLNWEIVQDVDKLLHEGDTISLKGKGKAVLASIGGKTKKDRITINIQKYV